MTVTIQMSEKQIVLASASPRRRELLALGGRSYSVASADVDERPQPGEAAGAYARRVAVSKARRCAEKAAPDALVIAADTTVALKGRILGKPLDRDEARRMLSDLRGRRHEVITSLAIVESGSGDMMVDQAHTQVPMREYDPAEVDAYIESGDPFDKAGGYAIQHAGFHPVNELDGCYANVVGLPLCHLKRSLDKLGVALDDQLPERCQQHFDYKCPVFERVLEGEL
jgi:septum formation protein